MYSFGEPLFKGKNQTEHEQDQENCRRAILQSERRHNKETADDAPRSSDEG